MNDYIMPVGDDVIQAAGPLSGYISLKSESQEVIRVDAEGFHYRGQFIEDAGEAHRLLVEFLRQHQPNQQWKHAAEPQPEPPTDEELAQTAKQALESYRYNTELPYFLSEDSDEYEPFMLILRAVFARWGS